MAILLVEQEGDDDWRINEELLPQFGKQRGGTTSAVTVPEFHMECTVKKPDQTHLSVDYLRYYWREPIVKNHVIIGPANLGRNMRYYWGGPMFD